MNVLKIRNEMRSGRSLFDLPLRVTFYARVSTDKEEQRNSLENQVQYYTQLIQTQPNWTYIPGYVDEGISGTTTQKREQFLRMMEDAKAGKFDFIITKEISRFSRSTLDSILYTQKLLEYHVGVLFQNDNINTLDPDSEFRLVVMAGVAQDEVRKLSERLKFGFRQAIKNGHVLGNDNLWGYDKKDCMLVINPREAEIIRRIFHLYANEGLGIRRISQTLYQEGITSRKGNPFNVQTIRHILNNPKYKGWYCAGKSQSIDYRTKKKVFFQEEDWVTYPDPSIPAIVPEELWDRANALYKQRSQQMMAHQKAAVFHNRYPYSGKILCEEHGTSFHRQVLKSSKGEKEIWQCRVYRDRGRKGCKAPSLQTRQLNEIMAAIIKPMLHEKDAVTALVVRMIENASQQQDFHKEIQRGEAELFGLQEKKERLLELHLQGILSMEEFKEQHDRINQQIEQARERQKVLREEEKKTALTPKQLQRIENTVRQELSLTEPVNSALASVLLDYILVKKESSKETAYLEIHLKFGGVYAAELDRKKSSFCLHRF